MRHQRQAQLPGRVQGGTRSGRAGDDRGHARVDDLVDEFARGEVPGRGHGPDPGPQAGQMGDQRRDRVVPEDGDPVVGAGRELQQPRRRPRHLVGEAGPGQHAQVVHQGGVLGCLLGATVEWQQRHGSSGGSSALSRFEGRGDAETVAFIKKVRNTLIPS